MSGRRGFLGAVLGLLAIPFVAWRQAKADSAESDPADPTKTRFAYDAKDRVLLAYDGRYWVTLTLKQWDEEPVFDKHGTNLLGVRHTVKFEGINPFTYSK